MRRNKTSQQIRMTRQARFGMASIICTIVAFICALFVCGMTDAHYRMDAIGPFIVVGAVAFMASMLLLIAASEA